MKPPWVIDEGLKFFPFSIADQIPGRIYVLGEYSAELVASLNSNSASCISALPDLFDLKFEFRNLIISDLSSAYSLFWGKQNSNLRNFATNSLIIPVRLGWLQMIWAQGFSSYESDGIDSWRWNIGPSNDGRIEIINRTNDVRHASLSFSIENNYEECPKFLFTLNQILVKALDDAGCFTFELTLQPGRNQFELFVINEVTRSSESDLRGLNYRVINLALKGNLLTDGENDFWMRWKLHESGFSRVQELTHLGSTTYSDGFFNEPIQNTFQAPPISSDRLTWYLASASSG